MLMLPPVQRLGGPARTSRRRRGAAEPEGAQAPEPSAPVESAAPPDEPEDEAAPPTFSEAAAPARPGARAARPYAPLVAQLIATTLGLAQTRARRRAAAADAAAAYRPVEAAKTTSRGLA